MVRGVRVYDEETSANCRSELHRSTTIIILPSGQSVIVQLCVLSGNRLIIVDDQPSDLRETIRAQIKHRRSQAANRVEVLRDRNRQGALQHFADEGIRDGAASVVYEETLTRRE